MRIKAYYDFYTDAVRPLKLILIAPRGGFDWTRMLYFSVTGPFELIDEFPDITGASVLISDMIRRPGNETDLGINLPQISGRHGNDIEMLYMEMDDVEEVLSMY